MCLNFVEGGGCHATRGKCLLGLNGVSANNKEGACKLHGRFDVWVTESNELLVTDLGFPSSEPKQCLALGINESLARRIAEDKVRTLGTSLLTSERICLGCQNKYWISEHGTPPSLHEIGHGYLCPRCVRDKSCQRLGEKIGMLQYWCG